MLWDLEFRVEELVIGVWALSSGVWPVWGLGARAHTLEP